MSRANHCGAKTHHANAAGVDIQDIVSPDSGELEATQAVLAAQIVSNSDEHLCSVATGATGGSPEWLSMQV